jgi:hypothetical protein
MTPFFINIYMFMMLVLLVICVIGVLHPKYWDTFTQCVGMSIAALGALSELLILYYGLQSERGSFVLALGFTVYGLGTMKKHYENYIAHPHWYKNARDLREEFRNQNADPL